MNKKILIWMLVLLVCANTAFALGVRSAKTEVAFQHGYHGSFRVVNNDHKDLKVRLFPAGELKDYIKIEKTELELAPSEDFKLVEFSLDLPEELPPGRREGKIVVEEQLGNFATKNGQIAANLQLSHKIYVNVPAVDKYVEAKVEVKPKDNGAEVVTTVKNAGAKDLATVKSKVEVYSGEEKIASYDNPPEQLEVAKAHSFTNFIDEDKIGEGSFRVTATVNYDENVLEIVKTFTKGSPVVDILSYDSYFMENKINEFTVELASRWNTILKDVYLTVSVLKDGKEVFSTKTLSFDMQPYERKKVKTFFDARKLGLGNYNVNLTVHYAGIAKSKLFEVVVMTKEKYDEKRGSNVLLYVLVGFMILIFIALLVLFYFVLCMKKGKL